MESLVGNNSADNMLGSLVALTAALVAQCSLLVLPLMKGLRLDDINNLVGLPANDNGREKPATKNKDASDIEDYSSQDYDEVDFSDSVDEDDDSDTDDESDDYWEGGAYGGMGSSDDDDDGDSDKEEDDDEDDDGEEVDNPTTPKKTN